MFNERCFATTNPHRKDPTMNNNTQTNINKAVKPAAETAVKPTAPATPAANKPVSKPTTQPAKKRRKKIRFKPNKGGMLALLALILLTAAVVTGVVFLVKGTIVWVDSMKNTAASTSGNGGDNTTPWNSTYVTVDHANTNIPVGDLILVNHNYSYPLTDALNSKNLSSLYGYEGYSSYYVLNNTSTNVRSSIIASLKNMIVALVENNLETLSNDKTGDRIIITSGYRDTQKQQELYDNKTEENYVALPGHSEHHTGLAVDVQVFTSAGATVLLRDSELDWLEAHAAEYGFVIRYDGSKVEITGILDEPWHIRYVGVPHATYMSEHLLCLEEYLELLRISHKYTNTPLEFSAGDQDYLVYYVEATADASFTSIPVPPASEGTYTISGDNMNGFIVTVTKTAK